MDFTLALPNREQLVAFAITAVPRIVAAVIVLVLFWVALRLSQPALRSILRRARFADALVRLLVDGVYRGALILLGAIMAASQLGINVGAALAGVGVVGLAVGFAAQETISNTISGFLIFWDRPFKVGDYVTAQDRYGEVREITLRTTRLRTLENTYVVIPNKEIMGNLLVNHSMYGETRVNVPVGIAYKEKIAEARTTLLGAVRGVEGVMDDPPPEVIARGLGSSSVDLEVRVWIDDARLERPVFFRVIEASKVALDRAGIEIPFPHLQLFIEDVRERIWERGERFAARAG